MIRRRSSPGCSPRSALIACGAGALRQGPGAAGVGDVDRLQVLGGALEPLALVLAGAARLRLELALLLLHGRDPALGADRMQEVEVLLADLLEHLRVLELVAVAGGDGAGEQYAGAGEVAGGEVADRDVERGELAGHLVRVGGEVVDVGVDPVPVGVEAAAQLGRDRLHGGVDLGVGVVVAAGDQVVVEVALAEDLGQRPVAGPLEQLELEEAVLAGRVADPPPGIGVGAGVDPRHAVGVAGDRHPGLRGAGSRPAG